jgi:hypothetical protein
VIHEHDDAQAVLELRPLDVEAEAVGRSGRSDEERREGGEDRELPHVARTLANDFQAYRLIWRAARPTPPTTPSRAIICGADKPLEQIDVTTPAGMKTYTDSFYSCWGDKYTFVANIGDVFTAMRAQMK